MRPHNYAIVILIAMLSVNMASSEYWFQFGAKGGIKSTQNSGASAIIQTITPQKIAIGSVAYWVGEDLGNGAFLQIGYLLENQSGSYPSYCDQSGCYGYHHIDTGAAEWFFEYFPSSSIDSFLGAIGPDGSAGTNGTFNNYSFYSNGNTWYFAFNGNVIGNVSLSSGNSGENAPIAFGEIANTSTSSQKLLPVNIKNLEFYNGGRFLPVSTGYSYIGYGVGSRTSLQNTYGVSELSNRINNFIIGSGLPQPPNNTQLWTIGYLLSIISKYGNQSNSTEYVAYSTVNISTPTFLYAAPGSRGVFVQWSGKGYGSYTGSSNISSVYLGSNITEDITRQPQYLVTVSSKYQNATGSGWYNANSTAYYSISSNAFNVNASSRLLFDGWSNGVKNSSGNVTVSSPQNITANWQQQYLINATADYGNVIGSGWHNKGSHVSLYLSAPVINVSSTEKIAFYDWNNGSDLKYLEVNVSKPVKLHASYKKQYLTTFRGINVNDSPVNATGFVINNSTANQPEFLYSGVAYHISSAYVDGFKLPVNKTFEINSSTNVVAPLPLYPVEIVTTDIFGIPVNATADLQMENGTVLKVDSGSSGKILLHNVPYGAITGSIVFSGINESVNTGGGATVHLFFISLFDIILFVIAIIVAAVIYVLVSRTLLHPKKAAAGTSDDISQGVQAQAQDNRKE